MLKNDTHGKEMFFKRHDKGEVSVLFYPSQKQNAPLLIDIHGGGFISGHHYSDDNLCEFINKKLDINVASIEYRYIPKVVFPTATIDCFDALTGIINDESINFNRDSIFLMGHSAGANIVAGMSLLFEGKKNIRGQILNYPLLDVYIDPGERVRMKYSIPPVNMKFLNKKYYPDKNTRNDPLASPIYMTVKQAEKITDSLIITCSLDNLREDAVRYAEVLKNAGVFVEHIEYEDAIHGFIEMVAAGKIKRVWWLGKALIKKQNELYLMAIDKICSFINERTS